MGAQNFNTDIVPQLDAVTQFLRDDTFAKLRQGVEQTVEVAKQSGSAKFLKEAEAGQEATEALIREFSSLCECCDRYVAQAKKLEAGLN